MREFVRKRGSSAPEEVAGDGHSTRVVVQSDVYVSLARATRISMPDETAGVLIGTVEHEAAQKTVTIRETAPLRLTKSRSGLVPDAREYGHLRSWVTESSSNMRVVGWYYTDPQKDDAESQLDLEATQNLFATDTEVLLLVDPVKDQGAFFLLEGGKFRPAHGFYEETPGKNALPVIPWGTKREASTQPQEQAGQLVGVPYAAQATALAHPVVVNVVPRKTARRPLYVAALLLLALAVGVGAWQGTDLLNRTKYAGGGPPVDPNNANAVAALQASALATVQAQAAAARVATPSATLTAVPSATPQPAVTPSETPLPTLPPAKTVLAGAELTKTLALEDTDFSGGSVSADGRYEGRSARLASGSGAPGNTLTGQFNLNLAAAGGPVKTAQVTITGLQAGNAPAGTLLITLNGQTVYSGPGPFTTSPASSKAGEAKWGTLSWTVDPSWLKQGPNTLLIESLAPDGGDAPVFAFDKALITWGSSAQ